MNKRILSLPLLLFLFLAPTYAYFYQATQHNEAARFDQARAILEERRFAIDSFRWNTADVALVTVRGVEHVFPAKAPGSSFLALVPMWLTTSIGRLLGVPEWLLWHFVAYLCTVLVVGVPSALAAVAVYDILVRMLKNRGAALIAVLATWLGTILFPFSTLYFGHAQTAALLVASFWILFRFRHGGARAFSRPHLMLGLAGLSAGFAVVNEYTAVFAAVPLALYLAASLWRSRSQGRASLRYGASFTAGALAMATLLGAYNYAAFGKLLFAPYQALDSTGFFSAMSLGFAGIHWPGWANLAEVLKQTLIFPQRGLLYLNPVLVTALPGFVLWYRRRVFRLELAFVAVLAVVFIVVNACYGDSIVYWGGGTSTGPRQLVPMLPFLALPMVFFVRSWRLLFLVPFVVSVFFMLTATATEPRVSYDYTDPIRQFFVPKFIEGSYGLDDGSLFDPERHKLVGDYTAFNMGGLARLPGRWQMAPLMVWWALMGTLAMRAAARTKNHGEDTA